MHAADRALPTVLHTSDWQCGRPFVRRAADALLRLADRIRPGVVIAAGDLTQRAKAREYRAAVELLGRLGPTPVVATPGNHDVPLYRAWERLFDPYRKWRRFVSEDLDTVCEVDGALFVALNSSAPRRAIVGGRLAAAQLDFAERAFASAPADSARCLVVHHHFVPVPSGEGGRPLPNAARWLERIEGMGVDVVFGGHVHQMHLTSSRDLLGEGGGPGVPLVACGTTTSRRGRGPEAGWNSLTVTRFTASAVEVTPYRLPPGADDFEADETRSVPRPAAPKADGVGAAEEVAR